MQNYRKIIEFVGVCLAPILALCFPLIPIFYDAITEPDEMFAYSTEYVKNPVLEWNRSMGRFLKQLDASSDISSDSFTRPLLKKIGKEITQSLPAILAETSFRPMDKYTVKIVNMSSRYDMKNVRVHFLNCEGADSVKTFPDTQGGFNVKEMKNADSLSVSVTYGQIHRSTADSRAVAYVMLYAEDASKCKAIVEAENIKGENSAGKSVNDVSEYNSAEYYKKIDQSKRFELIWKFIVSGCLLAGFFYIRSIKKRINHS